MNSFEKLLNFLQSIREKLNDKYLNYIIDDLKQENIEKGEIYDCLNELERIIKILSYSKEEWKENNCVFDDFLSLSDYLALSGLREKEKLEVILKIIELNVSTDVFNFVDKSVDYNDLLNYNFHLIDREEIEELIINGQIVFYLNRPQTELTLMDILKRTELNMALNSLSMDFSNIGNLNKKIYYILIKNEESLSMQGINIALDAMKKLGVDEYLISSFKVILEKKVTRRKKKKLEVSKEEPKKVIISKKYLSDKEYTALKKEIYTYYNIYKGTLNRKLSFEEAIYVASLMIKIDCDKSEIEYFFRMYYKEVLEEKNPIIQYLNNYEKMNFYYSEEEIKGIEDVFREIFICNDEDYSFWKKELAHMLAELNSKIKDKYSYEYSLAKKL